MKNYVLKILAGVLVTSAVVVSIRPKTVSVKADGVDTSIRNIELTNISAVNVDPVFGELQKSVDENIYYSMTAVNEDTINTIYGADMHTPMLDKLRESINPCMALATTWGEAGRSYDGVSMTTVMDFDPSTYNSDIDWVDVATNLGQVDSSWYVANVGSSFNVNEDGNAYKIPVALLQYSKKTPRETNEFVSLGVGPYQVTTSDWEDWDIDSRVSPILGFESSLRRAGTNWCKLDINPISDLTIYAALSLCHQGQALATYDFGKELISIINTDNVQKAFNHVGYQMYTDVKALAESGKAVCTSDINVADYIPMVQELTGINFRDYTGGPGRTNKGNYVASHLLRYCFYKYYFSAADEFTGYNQIEGLQGLNYLDISSKIAKSFINSSGSFDYSQSYGGVSTVINDITIRTPYRDCSSYVSAMMYFIDPDTIHLNSYGLNDNLMNWNKINVTTFGEMNPGDVIVKDGHTAMCVAKDSNFAYFGDCGSTKGIRNTALSGWSKYYKVGDPISSWSTAEESVYRAR